MATRVSYSVLQQQLIDSLEAIHHEAPEPSEIKHFIGLVRETFIPPEDYSQVLGFIYLLLIARPDITTNPKDLQLNLLWQDCVYHITQQEPRLSGKRSTPL